MTDKPSFVYVTYIENTAERVWQALTDADLTAQYWGHKQHLRLERRLVLGAPAGRRLGYRRCHRYRAGSRTAAPLGHDLRRPRNGGARHAITSDFRHRAVPRDRPADRDA